MPRTYTIPAKPKNNDEYLEVIAKVIFIIRFNGQVVEKKWPEIKKAFHDFSIDWVKDAQAEDLMQAQGMIKNKQKISTIIHNAKVCSDLIEKYGSLKDWVEKINSEHQESPLLSISFEEECQEKFKGIGNMTREWLRYVFVEGKDEPEVITEED